MLFLFPGWVQGHRWISRFVLSSEELSHGEHPRSCWWLFCILSFSSSTTAAHFPVGFTEKVILAIYLPKPSFLLPIPSPQKSFIKVMQAHVISMFVWTHACMHIHGTFTFDKCSNKQNFSHMSALKQINRVINIMEIFFLHLGENTCRYNNILLGNNQYKLIYHVTKTEGHGQIKSMKLHHYIDKLGILRRNYWAHTVFKLTSRGA